MEREGEGTKFTLDRKIFSSDIWFTSSPWKLKIFIYLVGQANFQDNNFLGAEIKRGQLIRGYRTIAKQCGYKIGYRLKKPALGTVHNIMKQLEKEGRIKLEKLTYEKTTKEQRSTIRSEHVGYLITVCNYDPLQRLLKHEVNTKLNTGRTRVEHNKKELKNEEEIKTIVEFLNSTVQRSFKWQTKETQQFIRGRLAEGYSVEDFKTVIEYKKKKWTGTDQEEFLQPSTLFRPTNFENYFQQATKDENKEIIG